MPLRSLLLPLGILLAASLATAPVTGRDLNQDEALKLHRSGQIMPLEEILAIVRRHYPTGQLLEAELEQHSHAQTYEYEIELLTEDGQARELEIDAHTGEILEDKEDD